MDNEEKDFIYIKDDEGNDEKFEVIYQFDYEEKQYIMVTPAIEDGQEESEETDVYAFRYEEDENGAILHLIEDEKEWDIIEEVFNTLNTELN